MAEGKSNSLKDRLIEAAETRIQENGIDKLSLRKLANDVGVSTMATYHHFENKQALLVHIAMNGYVELSSAMEDAVRIAPDPQSAVKAMMRIYFQFAFDKPDIYRLMFGREIENKRQIPEFKEASLSSFYIMANAVKSLIEAGDHDVDAETIGLSFWATMHGLVGLVADGNILYESESEEKIERLLDQAVRGLFFIQ